jgi:cyclase
MHKKMLKTRIIPCLDVKNGQVVKGTNFVDLKNAGDPIELAKYYNQQGADELCFLDISATKDKNAIIYDIISAVAKECFIPLTVGGGINSINDIKQLLLSGADKVSINSAAIRNPQLVSDAAAQFGSQSIVVAIDAKKNPVNHIYEIYTHGGTKSTGISAIYWAKEMQKKGAGEFLVTSMDRDGTKNGFDNELNYLITKEVSVPVIASGGVGELQDFVDGIIKGQVQALLAASVFHFGKFTIKEVKEFLNKNNVAVRMDRGLL